VEARDFSRKPGHRIDCSVFLKRKRKVLPTWFESPMLPTILTWNPNRSKLLLSALNHTVNRPDGQHGTISRRCRLIQKIGTWNCRVTDGRCQMPIHSWTNLGGPSGAKESTSIINCGLPNSSLAGYGVLAATTLNHEPSQSGTPLPYKVVRILVGHSLR
jgi:hypothetical protein